MTPNRRTGAQPGQIGKVRFKDITTKGVPEGKVLATDGQGGMKVADPSEVVGATQLDELADVGSAPEAAGFVLSADGTKYDGKSPDAAGLVTKSGVQDIPGQKSFLGGIKTNTIDSISGDVIGISKRISILPAQNLDEAATLSQALATTAAVTLGHPDGLRTPDFDNLTDAVESLTVRGGGIILILDNDNYEVLEVDGRNRDLRNITIVGQPGAEPSHMPFIHLQAPPDTVEQSSSSGGALLPTESTQWHIIGCRLSKKALELEPSTPDIHFGLLIEECAFSDQDPFGISVGGAEGAIEITDSDANVVLKHCYVESDFRANSNAWVVLSTLNTTKVRFTGLRPNFTTDASPASIQLLKLTTGTAEIFHDGTITPITDVSSTESRLQVDPAPVSMSIKALEAAVGRTADQIEIEPELRLTAFDAEPIDITGSSKRKDLIVTSLITIDPTTNGANGLDTGALGDVPNSVYHYYLIGDTRGINAPAGLVSVAAPGGQTMPSGYDVFRRLGAVRAQSASFLKLFNKDGFSLFRDAQQLSSVLPAGTTFVSVGAGIPVPFTSERVFISVTIDVTASGAILFVAHDDLVGASSGGIPIVAGQFQTGQEVAVGTSFVDINTTNSTFVIRKDTAGLTVASYSLDALGYVESL